MDLISIHASFGAYADLSDIALVIASAACTFRAAMLMSIALHEAAHLLTAVILCKAAVAGKTCSPEMFSNVAGAHICICSKVEQYLQFMSAGMLVWVCYMHSPSIASLLIEGIAFLIADTVWDCLDLPAMYVTEL